MIRDSEKPSAVLSDGFFCLPEYAFLINRIVNAPDKRAAHGGDTVTVSPGSAENLL